MYNNVCIWVITSSGYDTITKLRIHEVDFYTTLVPAMWQC